MVHLGGVGARRLRFLARLVPSQTGRRVRQRWARDPGSPLHVRMVRWRGHLALMGRARCGIDEIHRAPRSGRVEASGSPVSSRVFRLDRNTGQPFRTMVAAVLPGSKSS
jgi:hypothetical protein